MQPPPPERLLRGLATFASLSRATIRQLVARRPEHRAALDPVERRLLLEALDTVLRGDAAAVYLSTPITTGRRLMDWRCDLPPGIGPGHPLYESGRDEVVRANIEHARPIAEKVAAELTGHVIDPTRLGQVSGWDQFDFHQFWREVIDRFVATVVFVDGWEYSSGCATEFAAAVSAGRKLLREDLTPLTPTDGEALIAAAIRDMSERGIAVELLRQALQQVRAAAGSRAVSP